MLDAHGYLSRVVAPGNFYAFAFKRPEWSGLRHRFFRQSDITAAVNWLRYIGTNHEVWVGVASYRDAAQVGIDGAGQPRFNGKRTQANAEKLKAFWYDADIARPGDGKSPDRVWQNELEIVRWLVEARTAVGLPVPNLWIRSGYGVHLYWVMDAALSADQWLPYGRAFRALLEKAGARGDIGISADSARILRIPETFNHKVPGSPAPCLDITPVKVKTADYPIKDNLNLLTPFITTGGSTLGPPPPGIQKTSKLNANAQSGLERPPPYDFDQIAEHCAQVARTLDEGGEHDRRMMWHHMVNLAFACRNPEAAHRIGDKHPKYSQADTDGKYTQTENEHANKDFGAPACDSFNRERKGVCDTCPHWGKIKSPYTLGKPVVKQGNLPADYRQTDDAVEKWGKDGWEVMVYGVMTNAQLLRFNENAYRLSFDYVLSGVVHHAGINEADIFISADRMRQSLVRQGVGVNRYNTSAFGVFLMAWIEELRRNRMFVEAPPSFGWVTDDKGEYLGLSVAGVFYHVDGTQGLTQPGDRKIHETYQPKGSIEKWRETAVFVTKGRPDLQVLVAAAFAAPLMEFVGESSVMSVWSMRSGARKTSAFRVGTSVWCNPITGMSAIHDTTNSVQHSLAETRIMPVYWDEIHAANKDQIAMLVEMIFNITQGRGKSRLDSKIEQRDVGYWRTLMSLSTNRPISEMIEQDRAHTNAGVIRIFEYQMEPKGNTADMEASTVVAQVERNYGHAGRIFTQWVVTHIAEVKSFIAKLRTQLGKDLKTVDPNERFHVAAVLGIVTGAYFANQLKLLELDVKGIYKFLVEKMLVSRKERIEENPIDDEAKYLLAKFEQFMSDVTDELLVTQSFAIAGNPNFKPSLTKIKIIKHPGNQCPRAMVHIGLDNREMKFDYRRFKDWCNSNRLSPKAILEIMNRLWPVRKIRAVLGVGTDWMSGGKVYYYTLKLDRPELRHYLDWGTPTAPLDPTGKVVPLITP